MLLNQKHMRKNGFKYEFDCLKNCNIFSFMIVYDIKCPNNKSFGIVLSFLKAYPYPFDARGT